MTSLPPSAARSRVASVLAVLLVIGALLTAGAAVVRALTSGGVSIAFEAVGRAPSWVVHVPVWPTPQMPDSAWDTPVAYGMSPVQPVGHGVDLWLERPDRLTSALAESFAWLPWAVVAALLLVAVPVARRLVEGWGLTAGTARWVLVAAGVVAAGWVAGLVTPVVAAQRAIAAEHSGLPAAWFTPDVRPVWWPWLVVVLLVLLAATVAAADRALRRAVGPGASGPPAGPADGARAATGASTGTVATMPPAG